MESDETSQWKVTEKIMSPLEIMIRVRCTSVLELSRVLTELGRHVCTSANPKTIKQKVRQKTPFLLPRCEKKYASVLLNCGGFSLRDSCFSSSFVLSVGPGLAAESRMRDGRLSGSPQSTGGLCNSAQVETAQVGKGVLKLGIDPAVSGRCF